MEGLVYENFFNWSKWTAWKRINKQYNEGRDVELISN